MWRSCCDTAARAAVSLTSTCCTLRAAVTTADLDPGTDLDYLDAFEAIIPKLPYRHPHNPEHTPDHILSALVGTSASVPFSKGRLVLGTWQRLILVEFDGPRERQLVVTLLAEP